MGETSDRLYLKQLSKTWIAKQGKLKASMGHHKASLYRIKGEKCERDDK